jgi:hypothetical protein
MTVGKFLQALKHDSVLGAAEVPISTDTDSVWVTETCSASLQSAAPDNHSQVSLRVQLLAADLFGDVGFTCSVTQADNERVTTITPRSERQ